MTEANTIDATTAKRFVGEIEKCFDELLSERGEYMNSCRMIRERIKGWKEQAGEAGIPRKALNIELKRRELERKIEGLTADAEEEDVDLADMLRAALGGFGDTPLGAAAVADAEAKTTRRRAKKSDALDDLAGDKDAVAAAANEAALKSGIKDLH